MLPRNFPKFGSFLVNTSTKFSGIELDIEIGEVRLGFKRNVFAFDDALVRCLGCMIPFDGFIVDVFFGNQLENGLKEIDVEPQIVINTFQQSEFLLCLPAVIANRVSHDRPVFLFDMRRFGMLNILWRNLPAVKNVSSFDYSRASWFCNAGLRLYFSFVSPKYLIHSSVFPSSL